MAEKEKLRIDKYLWAIVFSKPVHKHPMHVTPVR
jgi:hypothetical protein